MALHHPLNAGQQGTTAAEGRERQGRGGADEHGREGEGRKERDFYLIWDFKKGPRLPLPCSERRYYHVTQIQKECNLACTPIHLCSIALQMEQ